MNGLDIQSQLPGVSHGHFYWQRTLEAHHWLPGSHDNQGCENFIHESRSFTLDLCRLNDPKLSRLTVAFLAHPAGRV